MSAEKPEVSDLWMAKKNGALVHVTDTDYGTIDFMENTPAPNHSWTSEYEFINEYRFVGRSKANIEDLFEVE